MKREVRREWRRGEEGVEEGRRGEKDEGKGGERGGKERGGGEKKSGEEYFWPSAA